MGCFHSQSKGKTEKEDKSKVKNTKEEAKGPKASPKDNPKAASPKESPKDTKKTPKAEKPDLKKGDNQEAKTKTEKKTNQVKETPKAKEKDTADGETASQETDRLYKKYMAEVDDHAAQRQKYFDEASKAHDAGDGKKAKELSTKGKEEGKLMEAAILKAGHLIYEGKNANNPVNKIDLHGLQVKQAELIVTELLEKCKSEGFDTAEVIHGKGLHSGTEGPKLKSAIRKMITDKGLKWKEGDTEGSILVELK